MSTTSRLVILSMLLFVLLPLAALAQEAKERPLTEKPVVDDGKLTGDQKIYVPFKNLKSVFEKEGQGVFVPFSEFMKLWRANLDRRPVPADPPVPFLITRARYQGRVDGDLAIVDAEIEFETFTEGWSAVPLGFSGIAMGEAKFGEEAATLEATQKGFRVLVPKKGEYALTLRFVTALTKSEDQRSLAFKVPPTPVSRLVFDVPEEGARVTVEPNLATTRTEAGSGVTRVMAYVGAADSVKLTWRPKPAEVKVGPALVFADANVTSAVEEAVLRVRADLAYTIHRAPVDSFRVAVPDDARVLFVEGDEVRMWDVADGTLSVSLHKPVENTYRLAVTLEKDLPEGGGTIAVPEVRAIDVAREQGFVLVRAPNTVKVLPRATGLYRTDFAMVPQAVRAGDLVLAYRYPAHPWTLSLEITRVRPVIDVSGRTAIRIDERTMTSVDGFTYSVSRAGIFTVRLTLPEGVKVLDVARDVVEDFRVVTEAGERILVLDLRGSKIGNFAVNVTTSRDLRIGEDPVIVPLPLLTPRDVKRFDGIVAVARDESLKIETGDVAGLVPMDAGEAGGGASLAFRYRQADRKATLTISRREPEVTAQVATMLRAEENRIAVVSRVTFSVKYAGVEEFAFKLPAEHMVGINVSGNNIREKPKTDLSDGWFLQRVVLQGKVLGDYVLTVEYDLPYVGLDKGESKSEEMAIPSLVVEDVKRQQGVFAVYRDPAFEIGASAERLEPIDPRELPAGVTQKDVFLAFKYLARPEERSQLTLEVEKHEFLDVLQTVVHHMHVITVLNSEGASYNEVVLRMTSNGLQFLSLRLMKDAKADMLEVFTDPNRPGKQQKPQAGSDGAILVRLPPEVGPNDVFWVKVKYPVRWESVPGVVFHDFTFTAPIVHGGTVPILGTTWFVYPPTDVKITQAGGTLRWLDAPGSWWSAVINSAPEIFENRSPGGRIVRSGTGAPPPGKVSDLAPSGQRALAFGGRTLDPVVEVTYADAGTFAALKVLVFLLFSVGGVLFLWTGERGARHRYLLACVAVPLLLIPVAAAGLAEVLTAVLLGGLLAGIYWCGAANGPRVLELLRRFGRKKDDAAGDEEEPAEPAEPAEPEAPEAPEEPAKEED